VSSATTGERVGSGGERRGELKDPPTYLTKLRARRLYICRLLVISTSTHPHPRHSKLAHTSSLDTDLTRNTRAPHFTPKHCLLCHMGLH